MRLLIVTSVRAEAEAIGSLDGARVVVAGIGRVNAASGTTEALLRDGPFDAVLNAGVAGALPGSDLSIGDAVVASRCVYAEEGMITPQGFAGMSRMGLRLGDFEGNIVPVDKRLLSLLSPRFRTGPIATVATCSGTDAAAAEIARRCGALAEAMEGAAVVHAARRLGVPAIELRAISNTTGNRDRQVWEIRKAMDALGPSAAAAVEGLRGVRYRAVDR